MQHAIKNLPLNMILCEGVTFKAMTHRQKWQFLIEGEVLFTFPHDFPNEKRFFVHGESSYMIRRFHKILRRYVDSPRNELMDFEAGYCDLGDVLKAADKRIGVFRLTTVLLKTNSPYARAIINYRLSKRRK